LSHSIIFSRFDHQEFRWTLCENQQKSLSNFYYIGNLRLNVLIGTVFQRIIYVVVLPIDKLASREVGLESCNQFSLFLFPATYAKKIVSGKMLYHVYR